MCNFTDDCESIQVYLRLIFSKSCRDIDVGMMTVKLLLEFLRRNIAERPVNPLKFLRMSHGPGYAQTRVLRPAKIIAYERARRHRQRRALQDENCLEK